MNDRPDIVVIGAGISGLTVAWRLHRAGLKVRVLEASPHVGGSMRSETRDGFILEKGPFNVIVRAPAFEDLLDEFADEVQVVAASREAGSKRFVLRDGRLRQVPGNPLALLTSPVLSFPGRLRLIRGLLASRRGTEADSIDDAAARRLGREAADVLVSAMVSGIVAGDSRQLHLKSSFPNVARFDREARSPLGFMLGKAFKRDRTKRPRKWRGLISFERGLGSLPEAIAARLGNRLQRRAVVENIEPDENGYLIEYCVDGHLQTVRCPQVVLATPPETAAKLLLDIDPEAAERTDAINASSIVVLNLGLDEAQVDHPLQGFGFLVPRTETEYPLLGVLFADSVFPHHAPDGRRLIRVFMGGTKDPGAATRDEPTLLDHALPALRVTLGLRGKPTLVDVCCYPQAIPQYTHGHDERVIALNKLIANHPGLHLGGNYLEGVSINDCIAASARLAERIVSRLSSRTIPAASPTPAGSMI